DFFFDEVEEVQEAPNEQQNQTVFRASPITNDKVNTKVTYQYPKNNQAPFRFPVIPDERNDHSDELTRPMKQRSHRRSRRTKRPFRELDSFKTGYHRQQFTKELEDVPAYIRRQQKREQIHEQNLRDEPTKTEKKENDNILQRHTRPEELDRVFRIRDGKTTPADSETDSSNSNMQQNRLFRRQRLQDVQQQLNRETHPSAHSHEVNERPEPIIQEKPDTQEEYRSKEVHNHTESEQPVVNTTATNAYGLEMEEERKSVPGYLLNDPL